MERRGLINTNDPSVIRREAQKLFKDAMEMFACADELEFNKADTIADALEGRLKHKQEVEYGYQLGNGKKILLKWSYIELGIEINGRIETERWFVCKNIVGRMAYKKDDYNNNWENSDLNKALKDNSFGLFNGAKALGEDKRIDTGVTILSRKQYDRMKKDLPNILSWHWLCSPSTGLSGEVNCVSSRNEINSLDVYESCGVRPAFRLKSTS